MNTCSTLLSFVALCAVTLAAPVQAADIFMTRHFEKQANVQDPGLTPTGQQRAIQLATLLSDKELVRVYATDYRRTQQTASPTADSQGLAVTSYDPMNPTALLDSLKDIEGAVLIVGHSNTVPPLIERLTGQRIEIGESDYGTLYRVSEQQGQRQLTMQEVSVATP
ncbi:histidine phosphatase family protein [Aestuariibacter halophilus]|uniref:Histidine phosphatase family protein n=1 Tax=Fluctibacter halophilus TaxID=226011 RepID=A0ABS8G9N0_9ALTE|nr:phosphoglycerate mutase family protein [Aestuariibacter halophilus]MCC2617279.1 histidine phosphatase family protein [Aestuariibacter halophilus]